MRTSDFDLLSGWNRLLISPLKCDMRMSLVSWKETYLRQKRPVKETNNIASIIPVMSHPLNPI